jgi:glycosyltransferase involved in cell wall biosynthesis
MKTDPVNTPLVSVLIPAFNCEQFIAAALEALLGQSFSDFECIIVNDGSTDETESKIAAFNDSRIRYVLLPRNRGIVDALNAGLDIANGKYILRTDADDIVMPGMIEDLVTYMESNPDCVVCGANMLTIGSNKVYSYPSENDELKIHTLESCPFSHSTVIIRHAVLRQTGHRYSNKYKDAEDYALWSALLPLGQFHNLEKCTLFYRESPTQITAGREYGATVYKSRDAIYRFQGMTYFRLNEEDSALYARLVLNDSPADEKKFQRIAEVMRIVVQANEFQHLFDQRLLKKKLFIKWFWFCVNYPGRISIVISTFVKGLRKTGNIHRVGYVLSLALHIARASRNKQSR